MHRSQVDLLLDSVPQEELISFFRSKKVQISFNIEDPLIFLNQLRDHSLIPEDLYQKTAKLKSKDRKQKCVYEILDWLEKERRQFIKLFWGCVFQNHILQNYPSFRSLQGSLLERIREKAEEPGRSLHHGEEKMEEQKMGATSRKKGTVSGVETDESSEDPEEDREQEQEAEEERESEPVDLSQFEPDVLPVSCDTISGDLYKNRFAAGSRSKSIRTEERWFTPEEFVRHLPDGQWGKDILCHGKTLHYLVKKKVLDVHSLLCHCELCCPDDPLNHFEDELCFTLQDEELGESFV